MKSDSRRPLIGVVLAAGKGTRMRSELPKVLHPVAGRAMLDWVLDALAEAGCEETLVVVGHAADEVRSHVGDRPVTFVEQLEQLGTGHALAQTEPCLSGEATLLVVSGDVPLVSPRTLARLSAAGDDQGAGAWGAMAISRLEAPGSLGRVVARQDQLVRIVEAADASADELGIDTVNAGLYALPAPDVFARLRRVGSDNAKGEVYLTDALSDAAASGERVALVELDDALEAQGVNDRRELALVGRMLQERHLEALALAGVTILDPQRTVIEATVAVGVDTIIHPGVTLLGETSVGAGCELHQGAWMRDSRLADGITVLPYSVLEGARVSSGSRVGPFARLRPGTVVGEGAKVGNFVEIKNSQLGAGAKAGHLAYLGDADIGAGANIGAGTITCNYDGVAKHPTTIGPGAFIGSDTMLVAPVEVGSGAITGAGSVITRDVPEGALAVERSQQRTIEGWARRKRRQRRDD